MNWNTYSEYDPMGTKMKKYGRTDNRIENKYRDSNNYLMIFHKSTTGEIGGRNNMKKHI